jgi:hypothetical protein
MEEIKAYKFVCLGSVVENKGKIWNKKWKKLEGLQYFIIDLRVYYGIKHWQM